MMNNMKLLLLLFMLIFSTQGAPPDPDDYFGQEEAEYDDYYYDDDTNYDTMDDEASMNMLSFNVGLVRSHRRKGVNDDKKNREAASTERLIQEIDARGSNITIHDSMVDKIDARGGLLNVHTRDTVFFNGLTGGTEDIDPTAIEPSPVAEALESTTTALPLSADEVVIDLEEPDTTEEVTESEESDVSDEDLSESTESEEDSGLEQPVISEDGIDFDVTFMDKLQGLQLGMESVVTILKEIAGKVGCGNAGLVERATLCPPPFELVGRNECLFLGQANKVTWASARQICSSLGADLAHPVLPGQGMHFVLGITQHTRAPMETVWVGASDRRQEGIWTWVNGHIATHDLPWASGHPKNYNGREDCMAMGISKPLVLQASNCMRKKPFICQKEYVNK